jgi:hypothetical protein
MASAFSFCSARNTLSVAVVLAAVLPAACGSSAETVTAPSGLARCSVALDRAPASFPASGGTGTVVVRTERECQWTISADAGWLRLTSGASGQGEATVQFTANANPDPVTRRGALIANGERTEVTQAAAECRFDLSAGSAPFPHTGGAGAVNLGASSSLCSWTAASNDDWIRLRTNPNGSGSARVEFEVAAGTVSRTGSLTIAGHGFTVTQAAQPPAPPPPAPEPPAPPAPAPPPPGPPPPPPGPPPPGPPPPQPGPPPPPPAPPPPAPGPPPAPPPPACSVSVNRDDIRVDDRGGVERIQVRADNGCAWEAETSESWIRIVSGSGTGRGTLIVGVEPNRSPDDRSGTIRIGTVTIRIRQEGD